MGFDSIENILFEIKSGRPVIMVDDEDRENEGDFLMAGELINKEWINFFTKVGRGLICAPISKEISRKLSLDLMVKENAQTDLTGFTVSVDAKVCTGSGISSMDRAQTILKLADRNSKPNDFIRPGHIFPLIAKSGGIKERRGHTEAAIEIMNLAKMNSVAVLCEILNEDGETAKLSDLLKISKKYDIKISSVEKLSEYLFDQKNALNLEKVIH